MYEEYDSETMFARYDKGANTVKLEWKKEASGDAYRTPLMHAAELIRKHGCDTMIIDASKLGKIPEADKTWTVKVFEPALKKSGLEEVIFVGKDLGEDFKGKIKRKTVATMEEAEQLIRKEAHPSAGIAEMTREQAIEYLGLPADADSTAIDDKFYQLAKRYRKSTDEDAEQKLADLSAAYNIASGRRDEEEQRELAHDQAKKIFGKTAEDWKTFFGYNWIKFVLGAGLIVFIISLVNFFTQGGNSCTVISFGNFGHTTSYISSVLELYGYSNPYVATVDYIVPNTEGLQNQQYADQTLAAFFSADPNVLITDEMTYVYYFSQFADLTDAYDIIMDEIPEDVAAAITPIYMSEREAYNLTKTYYEQIYEIQDYDAEIDESELSDKQIMIGLEITDPDMIEKLGFENWWHKQPPTLVFGIFSNTSSLADSIQVLITILKAAA
ncbi:MAG: J domain-containing protein [Clostridiales bacterium]|nr:J domain-containing protein [Clostridiales bacterium]MBQ4217288.1 J domain-containing protein [Clostridiales bacterium]MBQ5422538.1 J domain-containing protein [Clostridiales bacterium]